MSLKLGTIVDGRYRVTARIGHGGMSEVYEATDIINKRIVAIKLMKENLKNDAVNLKRFQNESLIAASLDHPNIVHVLSRGTVNGTPFIVNEFVNGQNLKNVLDIRGALPIKEAMGYIIQTANALSYAHKHKIIHRDIKPDNLFVLADGTIKLGDFGIAQSNNVTLDNEKDIVGSVHYLAPELINGKPGTICTDIYALGSTFFELITGHVPFEKNNAVDIAVAHVKEKFPSPKKYLPSCPKEIERIILKCTKKNPNERYQSMSELLDDLNKIKNNPHIVLDKKNIFSRIFGFK